MHLTRGSDKLHFFYDAQSRPAMVNFNGTFYSYVHNLQGDIVGIVDSAGNLVVEYKYDAWGKPVTVRTLTTAYEKLAVLNPFRYRGYVYDEETGLYYLRSRYYASHQCRFINADIFLGVLTELQAHNLFSYCVNIAVRYSDPDGFGIISALITTVAIKYSPVIIPAVAGAVATVIYNTQTDGFRWLSGAVQGVINSYAAYRSKQLEKAAAKEKILEKYRTDGVFAHVQLRGTGEGIVLFGPADLSFDIAFGFAINGEDMWTQNEEDAYALASAVAVSLGGHVSDTWEAGRGDCMHYHVYNNRGEKQATHFFFGSTNVTFDSEAEDELRKQFGIDE